MKKRIIPLTKDMEGEFNRAVIYAIVVLFTYAYASIAIIGGLSSKGFLKNTVLHVIIYVVICVVFGFVIYPLIKRILYPTKFN